MKLCLLTFAGGLAFWAVTLASFVLPVVPEFRRAFSIGGDDAVLVGSLLGGLLIAGVVSFALLRFPSAIPAHDPIAKSLLLGCVALGLATLVLWAASRGIEAHATRAFLIGALLNVPRFLALGAVVGWLHKRLYGTPAHTSTGK